MRRRETPIDRAVLSACDALAHLHESEAHLRAAYREERAAAEELRRANLALDGEKQPA